MRWIAWRCPSNDTWHVVIMKIKPKKRKPWNLATAWGWNASTGIYSKSTLSDPWRREGCRITNVHFKSIMIMLKCKWKIENDWHELAWSPLPICGFKWWHDGTFQSRYPQIFCGLTFAFIWPTLGGSGSQSKEPFFSLKFTFKTRLSSESLEALIGFPAFLEAKWWHKKLKVVKISTPGNGNLVWITASLYRAITRRQIRLESCSSPLKTREGMWSRLQKNV